MRLIVDSVLLLLPPLMLTMVYLICIPFFHSLPPKIVAAAAAVSGIDCLPSRTETMICSVCMSLQCVMQRCMMAADLPGHHLPINLVFLLSE